MSNDEAMVIFSRYIKLYEDSWKLYDDVIPFLEKYSGMGFRFGIITDGSEKQQPFKLEKTGIANYFEFVVTAEKVNASKPDRKIFEYGKEYFKDCEVIYYIGDNRVKDAEAANNAGMIGVWLNRKKICIDFFKNTLDEADINIIKSKRSDEKIFKNSIGIETGNTADNENIKIIRSLREFDLVL